MATPSSVVSREALQHRAYLLWEAAGFPPDQSDYFWLMAEQQLKPSEPVPVPARKAPAAAKRKPPATPPAPAAEGTPVHPTRRKAVAESGAPKPVVKAPARPAAKAPGKPAAKSPRKSAAHPPAKTVAPAAKRPAKPRSSKTGDAS